MHPTTVLPRPAPGFGARLLAPLAALALAVVLSACSQAQELTPLPAEAELDPPVKLDVPYVPTPQEIVDLMLDMAEVGPQDYLIDLGSGDGRIVISAVRDRGARAALGVEIDPRRVAEANANARAAGVEDRAAFELGDLFEKDFSSATVLTMYLLQSINLDLRPVILDTMHPGSRVVSHVFDMGDWAPDRYEWTGTVGVHLWIVPARVAGRWHLQAPDGGTMTLSISQRYQRIDGHAETAHGRLPLSDASLRGDEIRFTLGAANYVGKVDGDVLHGLPMPGAIAGWRATREPADR